VSALLQALLVAAVVAFAALSVLRQLWPRGAWQAQARLSYALERAGLPAWLRRVGFALRPPLQATQAACGSGCARCRACK
jgi:hypothetical protein